MAKRYTLSESDRRKLGAGVRRFASMPRDDSDRRQAEPFAAPREFLVGRADEAISPTTDPLTSGSINSGIVSVYRWNETNSAWEDTGDNVETYDFRGGGCVANEWVHLHRLGHAGGVLWILASAPPGYWHGHLSSSLALSGSFATVAFTQNINTNTGVYSNSSGEITIAAAGVYDLAASFALGLGGSAVGDNGTASIQLEKNNTAQENYGIDIGHEMQSTNDVDQSTAVYIGGINLAAGDVIRWRAKLATFFGTPTATVYAPNLLIPAHHSTSFRIMRVH